MEKHPNLTNLKYLTLQETQTDYLLAYFIILPNIYNILYLYNKPHDELFFHVITSPRLYMFKDHL
jgi:hypothetical protein